MGGRGAYSRTNHFADGITENEFFQAKDENGNPLYVGGIKVVVFKDGKNGKLPEFSNTSSEYISINKYDEMSSLRIYKDHFPIAQIDLGHPNHHGKKEGEPHVHEYIKGPDGLPCRLNTPPKNAAEILKKYEAVIKQMKETLK